MFTKQDSFRKGVILSTGLNIGAKAISFINALVLIYLFGTNLGTDSYFLVISTIGFIASFVMGIVNYVMIPEAMRIKETESDEAQQAYVNFFIWLFVLIGAILALIVWLSPISFYTFLSKYSGEELYTYRLIFLVSAVLFPLTFLVNLLVQVLASHRRFTVPMVVALTNSLISILLLIILGKKYGINIAIGAYAIGFIVNFVWLIFYYIKGLNWNFFRIRYPSRKNWQNILFIEINLLPVTLRNYLIVYMLSGLGAGVITSYNYGMQIALIPELMVVSQVAAVLGIKYNELSAKANTVEIGRLFNFTMRLVFFALLPIGCLMFLLANELLEMIFLFKKKDDLVNLPMIAAFLGCFALTLPFRALDAMLTLIVTAQQKIREAVVFGFVMHTSAIVLTVLAINYYGINGFLVVTVLIYGLLLPVFYYFFVRKVLAFLDIRRWIMHTALYTLLIGGITLLLYYMKPVIYERAGMVLTTIILGVSFAGVLYCVNFFIKYTDYSLRMKE
jgi:putative peptidoglycan lipid II flippase